MGKGKKEENGEKRSEKRRKQGNCSKNKENILIFTD